MNDGIATPLLFFPLSLRSRVRPPGEVVEVTALQDVNGKNDMGQGLLLVANVADELQIGWMYANVRISVSDQAGNPLNEDTMRREGQRGQTEFRGRDQDLIRSRVWSYDQDD